MANHEYAHCDNCLFFDGKSKCSKQSKEVDRKCWCEQHVDKDPLNANYISVEYTLRRDHIMLEMQHGKDNVKPIEEVLKAFGWDGTERLKQGKWPEENDNS